MNRLLGFHVVKGTTASLSSPLLLFTSLGNNSSSILNSPLFCEFLAIFSEWQLKGKTLEMTALQTAGKTAPKQGCAELGFQYGTETEVKSFPFPCLRNGSGNP